MIAASWTRSTRGRSRALVRQPQPLVAPAVETMPLGTGIGLGATAYEGAVNGVTAREFNPAEVHAGVHGRVEMAPGEGPKLGSGGARVGHEGHERRRSRDRRGRRSLRRCPLGNEREPQTEAEDQDE